MERVSGGVDLSGEYLRWFLICDSRNLTLQILMSDRVETVRSTIEAHYDNATSKGLTGF